MKGNGLRYLVVSPTGFALPPQVMARLKALSAAGIPITEKILLKVGVYILFMLWLCFSLIAYLLP